MSPLFRSFTIVVTDNDTGESYDASFLIDRAVSPEAMHRDFMDAMLQAALYHQRSGICPGVVEERA